MRIHSLEKIRELKKLREKGYSINELVEKFSMPKTTIWHHIQKVQVLPQYQKQLKAKRGGSAKRKQENIKKAEREAKTILQGPNKNLAIALCMLYWGEGSKNACQFINSDWQMIKSYLIILKKLFNITVDDLRLTMRIFTGMKEKECLEYWANIVSAPKSKFKVRFNDGCTRGKTKYGMCRITIKKGSQFLKIIKSLIKQASDEIIDGKL